MLTCPELFTAGIGARCTNDLPSLVEAGEVFSTVYADPPWRYNNTASRGAAENHYPTMPLADICALPVKSVVADDAFLFLWTTTTFLFSAFEVIEAWGFEYADIFEWCKPQLGLGNYWRVSHESLLLGVRGNPTWLGVDIQSYAIEPRTRRHSQKPARFRRMVEQCSCGPYLEMFGREAIEGWTVFGNEVKP